MAAALADSSSDEDEDTDFIGFSPIKGSENKEGISQYDIDEANKIAKQLHVFKPGITFVPGAKLEVLDARDNKWYKCRVVEVDWGELDILVHYDRWSVRFDEWLKMDSTRIKPFHRKDKSKAAFKIGEKVLGFWMLDSKYYLGKVIKITSDDHYEVLFYDGYTKCLRSSQLKKLTNPRQYMDIEIKPPIKLQKSSPLISSTVPSPSFASVSLDMPDKLTQRRSSKLECQPDINKESSYIVDNAKLPGDVEQSISTPDLGRSSKHNIFNVEILEAKRKTKRTPDVERIFESMKRKRKSEEMLDSEEIHPSRAKIRKQSLGNLKRDCSAVDSVTTNKDSPAATSDSTSNNLKNRNYFEIDLTGGWKKVCRRRSHCSLKWDVYYLSPTNKKLRTREGLIKYNAICPLPVSIKSLDFSLRSAIQVFHRQNSKTDNKMNALISSEEINSDDNTKQLCKTDTSVASEQEDGYHKDCDDIDSSGDELSFKMMEVKQEQHQQESPSPSHAFHHSSSESDEAESSPEKVEQSVQDVLPTVKLSQILQLQKDDFGVTEFEPGKLHENTIYPQLKMPKKVFGSEVISSTVTSPSHKCPHESCEKSFRKESLLQMHMKHYHPELLRKKHFRAPNVADLAYARTVGDHLDVVSVNSLNYPSNAADDDANFMIPDSVENSRRRKISSENKKVTEKRSREEKLKKEAIKSMLEDSGDDQVTGDESSSKEEDSASQQHLFVNTRGRTSRMSDGVSTRNRSRKSGSVSEDEQSEKFKGFHKNYSRKICTDVKLLLSSPSEDGQSEVLDKSDGNQDSFNEPQSDSEDAIIHCGCKSQEEDGLMLQCDICLTWQHGSCYNIENESQVPDKYICSMCENSKGQRSSMRFRHHQEWLKEGRLPRFSFSKSEPDLKLEACVRRGHELTSSVLKMSQAIYSLRMKLNIAKEADHPKFVMWHEKWSDSKSENIGEKPENHTSDHQFPLLNSNFIPSFPPHSDMSLNQPSLDCNNVPLYVSSLPHSSQSAIDTLFYESPIACNNNGQPSTGNSKEVIELKDPINLDATMGPSDKEYVLPENLNVLEDDSSPMTSAGNCEENEKSDRTSTENSIDKSICDTEKEAIYVEEGLMGEESSDLKEEPNCPKTENSINKSSCDVEKEAINVDEGLIEAESSGSKEDIKKDLSSPELDFKIQRKEVISVKDLKEEDIIDDVVKGERDIPNVETSSSSSCASTKPLDNTRAVKNEHTESSELLLKKDDNELSQLPTEFKDPVSIPIHSFSDHHTCRISENNKTESKRDISSEIAISSPEVTCKEVNSTIYSNDAAKDVEAGIEVANNDTKETKEGMETPKEDQDDDVQSNKEDLTAAGVVIHNFSEDSQGNNKENLEDVITESTKGTESDEDTTLQPDALEEDAEDFDLALGALESGTEGGINDGLVDLLSSHPVLDQLVDVPLDSNSIHMNSAPIIPKNERIEPVKCKLNLLAHIEEMQNKLFGNFDLIENHLQKLETEVGLPTEISPEEENLLCSTDQFSRDSTTVQTRAMVKQLLNDIDIFRKLAEFSE